MNIGLDYDGTYSDDPRFWDEFIRLAKVHGHKVHIVTCRRGTEANREECDVYGVLTYFTGLSPKDWFMKELGISIDWWIDDYPDCVKNGR